MQETIQTPAIRIVLKSGILFAEIGNPCYIVPFAGSNPRFSQARAGRKRGIAASETFGKEPETRPVFSYFFGRNPLKSPDSDE